MGRAYNDPGFASKRVIPINFAALNGTVTSSTVKGCARIEEPIDIYDCSASFTVGGVLIDTVLLVGRSLAGTGAFTAIGTMTLTGTQAVTGVVAGSASSTGTFIAGDQIQIARAAGTETGVAAGVVYVNVKERFVETSE
jgi:hypothetical protein